ncbi:hypothetical protein B0I35DRAFT_483505 [Stachybotrys elegans]|uniref:Serine-rich protein n=1 Tax=Stachybotrys elegans TaxID=80388 RepID=A0A8K0SCK0_9HYPO|nr:hypothetical protein B0I35DRAFT_483505 [Stachybotrys elegans]
MSTTPQPERSSSPNSRFRIRIVPYSPPRLSDGSGSSGSPRPLSGAESPSSQSDEFLESTIEADARRQPSPNYSSPSQSPGVSGLRRGPVIGSPGSSSGHSQYGNRGASDSMRVPSSGSDAAPRPVSPLTPPIRRARKAINIHSDNKTFSVVLHSQSSSSRPSSVTVPSSSYGRSSYARSSDAFADETPTTPLTPLAEQFSSSSSANSSKTNLRTALVADSSPPSTAWDSRPVGGLRQVPATPDTKPGQPAGSSLVTSNPDQSLPEITSPKPAVIARPRTSGSVQSFETNSTLSDRTNYKIYGESSPVPATPLTNRLAGADLDSLPPSSAHTNYKVYRQGSTVPVTPSSNLGGTGLDTLPPSSSHSNYQILAESSSEEHSVYEQPRPQTGDTEANFVVHGGPSASSVSLASTQSRVRPEYSQESLVVPPLRPVKKRSVEFSSLAKSRSRDSLRTGSFTSISSVLTQEATRALFVGAATINIQSSRRGSTSGAIPSAPTIMASYPHQWSSQLSTVFSESDGSEPATRSVSPLSAPGSVPGRRSSGFNSSHSRHMLSISSSLAGLEDVSDPSSPSRNDSIDRPQPAYNRNGSRDPWNGGIRLVRDHDEDGDGLADLHDHTHPSRNRLASFVSTHSADRNIWSSGSSRANSFSNYNNSAIPGWARLYYGSGERRLLIQPSSDSLRSQFLDSRPTSSRLSPSPSMERFSSYRFPGRRPRDQDVEGRHYRTPGNGSTDTSSNPIMYVTRGLRRRTSSLWSPHLQHDKRPTRYSIWEPPSTVWSTEGGSTSYRNVQVILFVIGFIFPLAWMIAAVLPLPKNPQLETAERLQSTSHLDLQQEALRQSRGAQESQYRGARWWRSVNRMMSVVGLLLIGAAIALAVVGSREQWSS